MDRESRTVALDRQADLDDLRNLTEQMTAGLKLADLLPGRLADTIVLDRLADPRTVAATLAKPVHQLDVSGD